MTNKTKLDINKIGIHFNANYRHDMLNFKIIKKEVTTLLVSESLLKESRNTL